MQRSGARQSAGLRVLGPDLYLLYADEFGHDGVWDPDLERQGAHPLFGLAGFAIGMDSWRELDRQYLRLKQSFYPWEIEEKFRQENLRPERFEIKQLNNRRDTRFATAVLGVLRDLGARVFIQGRMKPIRGLHDSDALYGAVTQRLMLGYERYIRRRSGRNTRGLIVMDRRSETRDVQLLFSAQSYLFSAAARLPGGFVRVIEVPLLVRSEWHHGVQAADTVARAVGRVFRYRLTASEKDLKYHDALGPLIDGLKAEYDDWSSFDIR